MSSRNEQFVCFTAVLAVVLPAAMWFRYVGPLRESLAVEKQKISEMRATLAAYTEAELLPESDSERGQADRIRATHDGIAAMMGTAPSVSEMYRGIEQAAEPTPIRVVRIEPGRTPDRSTYEGPLGTQGLSVETRTYRIEIEGPVGSLPEFLKGLRENLDHSTIGEVRLQLGTGSGLDKPMTATVVVESFGMTPLAPKEGKR